jgi:protein-S-isoprenylcysteine O-methyltransferase Ste14
MRRWQAAIGTVVFFVVAPGTVAGLIPWWISGWTVRASTSALQRAGVVAGCLIILAGVAVLVRNFIRFVAEGGGTPAPPAPTDRLVIGGDYRYVRNPMYVAVVGIVLGQALLFGSVALLLYGLVVWATTAAFVRWYEEPALRDRYGAPYQEYCANVRAWLPRRTPWQAR